MGRQMEVALPVEEEARHHPEVVAVRWTVQAPPQQSPTMSAAVLD